MTELTNTMTKQELIATQNVNNMENGSLISRVEQNEQDISTLQPCIMTVDFNRSVTLSGSSGALSFDNIFASVGNKLTNSNGGITIGAGVSKVKVGFNLWAAPGVDKRVWFMLRQHKSGGGYEYIGDIISVDRSGFVTGSISPVLVNVKEGDYFAIGYSNDASGVGINQATDNKHATNLTVEVIE